MEIGPIKHLVLILSQRCLKNVLKNLVMQLKKAA